MTQIIQQNDESKKFTYEVIWVAVSQLILSMGGLFTLPALTKSYSSELYGVWIQSLTTIELLSPILSLYLGNAIIRFLSNEEDLKKIRQNLGISVFAIFAVCLLFLIGASIMNKELAILLFDDEKYNIFVIITAAWIFSYTLFTFSFAYFRSRREIKKRSIILISYSILKISVIVLLAHIGCSLQITMISIVIIQVLGVIIVWNMILRELGGSLEINIKEPRLEVLKEYLVFSLPLASSSLLLWIINSSDRYFITHILDLSQTGIYSVSYTLGNLISLFYWPISYVLFPVVSSFWENDQYDKVKNYLEWSTNIFLIFAIPAAVGLYVVSQPLLKTISTSEFLAGGNLVFLISIGIIFLGIYQINYYIILLAKKTHFLIPLLLVGSFINIAFNMILIPRIGIYGAAISTFLSFFTLTLLVTFLARKTINYKFNTHIIIKILIATMIMFFALNIIDFTNANFILPGIFISVITYLVSLNLLGVFPSEIKRTIIEMFRGIKPDFKLYKIK